MCCKYSQFLGEHWDTCIYDPLGWEHSLEKVWPIEPFVCSTTWSASWADLAPLVSMVGKEDQPVLHNQNRHLASAVV